MLTLSSHSLSSCSLSSCSAHAHSAHTHSAHPLWQVVGGNSAWASSGINAVDPALAGRGDSLEVYVEDMLKGGADPTLAKVLVENSHAAVEWLRQRGGVELQHIGQLGGHSYARTYRPGDGLTGSKLVFALKKVLTSFSKDKFKLQLSAKVNKLLQVGSKCVTNNE